MAITLDQLASQEQLHYQVIKQNIDNLYLNLNSSNNSQTTSIVNTINNQTNNLGGQLYTQSNRVIQSLEGQAITLANQTLNTMRGLFTDEYKKLDSVTNIIQQTINTSAANVMAGNIKLANDLNALIQYGIDKLYTVVINTSKEGKDLQLQIEGNLNRAVDAATLHDKENTDRTLGTINDYIKIGNLQVSKTVADNAKNILANLSGLNTGEPEWLSAFMEQVFSNNTQPTSQASDTFFTFLIRLISGNSTANAFNALDSANISGELLAQITKIGAVEQHIINGDYKTVDDFKEALTDIGVGNSVLGSLIQLPFIIANIGEVVKSLGLPTVVKIDQLLTAAYSLKQLNEADILQAYIRNNMPPDEVHKQLDNLGHSSEDSSLLMKNVEPKYTPQELLRLGYLGKFNAEDLKKHFREIGWNEIDFILHGYLNQPRPGVNDLINFAVKEVYSPDVYQKFGQYQEFPKTFADQAKLVGLSEEFAQQYWAAHWNLPGAQQGFDMFHRGLITHEDLVTLLKSLDVMPFWRDKLINLTYNLIGRIDTRRLYAYGIWDSQRVYKQYLAEGYSPQDAQDLTQFTIQYDNEQDNKHKTALQKKAHDVYIKSYNNRLIDKATCKQHLISVGYKAQDIDLELSLEDYEEYVDVHKLKKINHTTKMVSLTLDGYRKRAVSRKDLLDTLISYGYTLAEANTEADITDKESDIAFKEGVVKSIEKLYLESLIDDNAVLSRLVTLGFANGEALHIISQLQTMKTLDLKKPTPQQFKTAYENGQINYNEYYKILGDMGYNELYIPLIIGLSDSGK